MNKEQLIKILQQSGIEFTATEWQIVIGNLAFEFDYAGELEKVKGE